MSDGWNLHIFGDRDAERRIEQLALFLTDLRPFWPEVARLARSWWKRQFDTQGTFGGHPWAALSPTYAQWKARVYPGKPILQATGAMKRAASNPSRAATPTSLTLTIEDAKVGYHQEGGGRLPARPLVFGDPLPAAARAELQQAADAYVRDLLNRL